jgi:predicted nucleotidyltransferase
MRLDTNIIRFFKQRIVDEIPDATLYLFGSRTSDDEKGGDIDLMILTNNPVDKKLFRPIRIEFFKKFGWQKVDLVNFTYDDNSVFKRLIQTNAIEL